jgi:uncharacterized protein YyaL (SSP411 family)
MNRLARERSPYLLQHAANPVDWFPWGEDAFVHARRDNKPIFLSIGYSTCHWCHVMERESFENDEVAALLNREFVSIKVDREERPDVDRVYMTFVQASTGAGGWPMSVWLTPDLQPFYGGTYFPPTSRWGRPGFVDILNEIARVWKAEREKVVRSAEALTTQLRALEPASPVWTVPGPDALIRTVEQFRRSFDERYGGFGGAPKFPRPSELLFLMREHARTHDSRARDMVLQTLRAMALGGMRDHVGGGFHRYSVDAEWRVPHFEKMLYDQAQLALAYIEAAQVSGDPFFTAVAEDTLLYVTREMADAEGGFYSAEDADSAPPEVPDGEKKEGAFYLWRADEIDALFGADSRAVKLRFGIEPDGNAPQDPQQEFTGKNLLYVARSIDDIARETGRSHDHIVELLQRVRVRMFEARSRRPRPHRDDKVLTAWNGLMIGALARTARVLTALGSATLATPLLHAAIRAASFLRDRMWQAETGILLRRYRDGQADIPGYAEDYAYVVFGLVELFQADPQPVWLQWAIELQRRQDERFWDEQSGGWFSTDGRDPTVLLRLKEDYDGAEPAASSVSSLNLLFLSHLVEDASWQERIEKTLKLFGSRLEQSGRAVPMMSAALSTYVAGVQQIVVATEREDEGLSAPPLEHAVGQRYLPFALTLTVTAENRNALAALLPLVASMHSVDGRTAVYVCRDFACRQPVTTIEALQQELETPV